MIPIASYAFCSYFLHSTFLITAFLGLFLLLAALSLGYHKHTEAPQLSHCQACQNAVVQPLVQVATPKPVSYSASPRDWGSPSPAWLHEAQFNIKWAYSKIIQKGTSSTAMLKYCLLVANQQRSLHIQAQQIEAKLFSVFVKHIALFPVDFHLLYYLYMHIHPPIDPLFFVSLLMNYLRSTHWSVI